MYVDGRLTKPITVIMSQYVCIKLSCCTLNLPGFMCQLHLNKAGKDKIIKQRFGLNNLLSQTIEMSTGTSNPSLYDSRLSVSNIQVNYF